MSYNRSANINIMLKATRKASRILIRDYGEICHLQSSLHNIDGFVATAKKKVQAVLLAELQQAREGYNVIIDEVMSVDNSSAYSWHINAISGIMNFAHALPNFTISIGLTKNHNNLATVIDAPILGETYFAEKGCGAFLERYGESNASNARLRVSVRKEIIGALIAQISLNSDLILPEHSRNDGSTDLSLAYLAAGRYDAVIGYDKKLLTNHANLLVLEAGGAVVEHHLAPFIASNNIIKLFKD